MKKTSNSRFVYSLAIITVENRETLIFIYVRISSMKHIVTYFKGLQSDR